VRLQHTAVLLQRRRRAVQLGRTARAEFIASRQLAAAIGAGARALIARRWFDEALVHHRAEAARRAAEAAAKAQVRFVVVVVVVVECCCYVAVWLTSGLG
jgi:hypothetical protein